MPFQIIYVSTCNDTFTKQALKTMLEQIRPLNEQAQITGVLLYRDGNVMQAIEGDKAVVTEVFNKISKDPRHRNIIRLLSHEVPQREFSSWSMGFQELSDAELQQHPGFNQFMNTGKLPDNQEQARSECLTLLRVFRDSF